MRKVIISVCLVGTVLLATPGHSAQKSATDTIEAAYSACIERSEGTTADMIDCSGEASSRMDKRLNQLYNTLMKKLPKSKQELLRNAQRKWLAWRDAELSLSYALDPNEGGTAQTVSAGSFAYEMLKRRVEEFEGYLNGLEL